MSQWLAVLVDDQPQLEFDHSRPVPQVQLDYLDAMDARMHDGIELDGEFIAAPDIEARVRFVARNLALALAEGNDRMALAMCTYLGVRRPALKQVKIASGALGLSVDLDYETEYRKSQAQPQVVTFDPGRIKLN